jgi:hypothetical protein
MKPLVRRWTEQDLQKLRLLMSRSLSRQVCCRPQSLGLFSKEDCTSARRRAGWCA